MKRTRLSWAFLVSGVFSLALAACALVPFADRSTAQTKEPDDAWTTAKFHGAGSCMRCHTLPTGNDTEDFVLLTEFATWRVQDRHSLAYFALVGPRGKKMAEQLKIDVTKAEAGCLACHSMAATDEKRRDADFDIRDGVSCDACHGPAEKWIGPHSSKDWRLKTALDKEKLGMRDLRDPMKRADLCMSCHVGNASEGKVVTHSMFAAGHPPLPAFEVGFASRHMPRHWRDKKDVPFLKEPPAEHKKAIVKEYGLELAGSQQAQLTTASALCGLKTAMNLVSQRSDLAANNRAQRWPELSLTGFDLPKEPKERWPEIALAHSDCSACHHELVRPSWRQKRGYAGTPGRVPVRSWPMALVQKKIGHPGKELAGHIEALTKACDAQPFGDAAKVHAAAADLISTIDKSSVPRDHKPDHAVTLRALCTLGPKDYPDYESARQLAAAFLMIYGEWEKKPAKEVEIQKVLAALAGDLCLVPGDGRKQRVELLAQQFRKMSGRKLLVQPGSLEALLQINDHGLRADYPEPTDDKRKHAIGESLRRFLETIREQSGKKFTETLARDETFLSELQKINDAEQEAYLKKQSEYDPEVFRDRMKKLADLLAGVK